MSFNGSSDYTDLGTNVGNYTMSDSFTLEAWINPALDSANRAIFGNAYAAAGYLFRINTANKARFIIITDGSNYNGRDSSTQPRNRGQACDLAILQMIGRPLTLKTRNPFPFAGIGKVVSAAFT